MDTQSGLVKGTVLSGTRELGRVLVHSRSQLEDVGLGRSHPHYLFDRALPLERDTRGMDD